MNVAPETNFLLTRVFGPTSRIKLIAYVLSTDGREFTTREASRGAGISYQSALRELKSLEALGMIYRSRIVGRGVLWKLSENDLVSVMKTVPDGLLGVLQGGR